ncbi:MAG: peptidase, partial [Actinomycetota bacterium]|nr:peptidase [Actinomycetota bacterium]
EELTVSDTIKAGLRERLGVTDADASDETVLAALDEALAEQADTTPRPAAAALPAGFTAIDESVLAELQANARLGAEARAEQERTRRDGIVADALRDGRIAAASRAAVRAQLDKDEAGTVAFLNTLPKNAVPVEEVGHSDTLTSADDALYGAVYGSTEKEA